MHHWIPQMDDVCVRITFTIAVVLTIMTLSKLFETPEKEDIPTSNHEVLDYITKRRFFGDAFAREFESPFYHWNSPHSLKAFSAATTSSRASWTKTSATTKRPVAWYASFCWFKPISLLMASAAKSYLRQFARKNAEKVEGHWNLLLQFDVYSSDFAYIFCRLSHIILNLK